MNDPTTVPKPSEEERGPLGQKIAARRDELIWTYQDLHRAAKVNVETIKRVERGQGTRRDTLARIVQALFPHTGGDWRRINEDAPEDEDVDAIAERVTSDVAKLVRQIKERGGPVNAMTLGALGLSSETVEHLPSLIEAVLHLP